MWILSVHIKQMRSFRPRADLWARTDEDRAEEERDGDVDDRRRHVQKPVGSHGKKSEEEQEEEQTVPVVLHLEQDRHTRTQTWRRKTEKTSVKQNSKCSYQKKKEQFWVIFEFRLIECKYIKKKLII